MKNVRRHPEGMLTDETYHTVGVTGFEPATTWSQTRCATGLRYAPNIQRKVTNFFCINQIIFSPCVSFRGLFAVEALFPEGMEFGFHFPEYWPLREETKSRRRLMTEKKRNDTTVSHAPPANDHRPTNHPIEQTIATLPRIEV